MAGITRGLPIDQLAYFGATFVLVTSVSVQVYFVRDRVILSVCSCNFWFDPLLPYPYVSLKTPLFPRYSQVSGSVRTTTCTLTFLVHHCQSDTIPHELGQSLLTQMF